LGRFAGHERKAGGEDDYKNKDQCQHFQFPKVGHSLSPPSMEEFPITCRSDSDLKSGRRGIYIREHVEMRDALSGSNIRPDRPICQAVSAIDAIPKNHGANSYSGRRVAISQCGISTLQI
jgi:hypothetical protein